MLNVRDNVEMSATGDGKQSAKQVSRAGDRDEERVRRGTLWALDSRLVGRVFTLNGCMHFVLEVDHDTGFASISCRVAEETRVLHMPISEVSLRVTGVI